MPYSADDLRRLLADNERFGRRARSHQEAIHKAAEAELARAQAVIDAGRPGALVADDAAARAYLDAVENRARMARLLAR